VFTEFLNSNLQKADYGIVQSETYSISPIKILRERRSAKMRDWQFTKIRKVRFNVKFNPRGSNAGKMKDSTITSQAKPQILEFQVISYTGAHLKNQIFAEMRKTLTGVCGTRRFIAGFTLSAIKLY
jgi:hypothetical protein